MYFFVEHITHIIIFDINIHTTDSIGIGNLQPFHMLCEYIWRSLTWLMQVVHNLNCIKDGKSNFIIDFSPTEWDSSSSVQSSLVEWVYSGFYQF